MKPDKIFSIQDDEQFARLALEMFRFQHQHNDVYRQWCNALGIEGRRVHSPEEIPFLPIGFFKSHRVVSFSGQPVMEFRSSGTTGSIQSRHLVAHPHIYEKSFLECFRFFYGEPSDYCILALLPAYLEREGSSLVYMAAKLIELSQHPLSGFYLDQADELISCLEKLMMQGQKVLLLGVSFALLDLAEKHPIRLDNTIIMETGGMKGRRRELVRQELHQLLGQAFGQQHIHSEYGMTELFSQAYSRGDGIFFTPPWMRVVLRDSSDPLSLLDTRRSGGINVIDLANVDSCSFIATEDLGKLHPGGGFEVLGRFDHSDTRGCNLMAG